ncbi:MAG TPA: ABC transporter permease, partial [Candidatus Blautia stercoripullorum]|nr:ABC transporter permease [Candidatus Blautia stercoripullorum]
ILTAAVALTVMMLFGVFSLAVGKLETDILLYMRNSGTAASTTLERGSKEQQEKIEALPYIKAVGSSVYIGNTEEYSCEVLDETGWEKMTAPAYSDIHGAYPQKAEEIMLPVRALEEIGIHEPELGMEIPASITLTEGGKLEKTFILSGYYTDYLDPAIYRPAGYFSQEFLQGLTMEKEENTTLLIQQKDNIDEEAIEDMLYRDVEMRDDSQQFFGGISVYRQSVYDLAGGFDTAVLMAGLILFGAAMLLYNVMYISLSRDIRQYGLLKTMGTTKKQLRSIVLRQTGRLLTGGCVLGGAAGILITVTVIPRLLSGMYLQGRGEASAMIAFRPWILALAVVFGGLVTLLSSLWAMNRVVKMSPVEAVKYTGQNVKNGGKKRSRGQRSHRGKKGGARQDREDFQLGKKEKSWGYSRGIPAMAWRNLFRLKKRFVITLFSLSLGILISLGAVVLSAGTDQTNKINQSRPDFMIQCQMNTGIVENYPADEVFFPPELREKFINLKGVVENDTAWGGYGKVDLGEEALQVYTGDMENRNGDYAVVVQAVSDQWLKNLEKLKKEKDLYIDPESVRQGNGLILFHYHTLSRIQEEKGKENVGKEFRVTDLAGEHSTAMKFAGYLDYWEKGLDRMATTWNGGGILYFLTSEKGFQKLGLPEQVFRVELEVEEEKEPLLKGEIADMISRFNKKRGVMAETEEMALNSEALIYNAKSDELAAARDYITSSRIVMGALCTLLLMMGIANYFNVTMTSLAMRRRELAVLESLGLTRRQLRKMLLLEGIFTALLVTLGVLTVGSLLLWAEGILIKQRLAYFVFQYPTLSLALCLILLFFLCGALPLSMYRKTEKQPVVERLKVME